MARPDRSRHEVLRGGEGFERHQIEPEPVASESASAGELSERHEAMLSEGGGGADRGCCDVDVRSTRRSRQRPGDRGADNARHRRWYRDGGGIGAQGRSSAGSSSSSTARGCDRRPRSLSRSLELGSSEPTARAARRIRSIIDRVRTNARRPPCRPGGSRGSPRGAISTEPLEQVHQRRASAGQRHLPRSETR